MKQRFDITDWQAFAPGLENRAQWLAWVEAPTAPRGSESPPLVDMPPMQRRRVEQLGRMALQVAYWCQQAEDASEPLVFASRHGDLSRTYDMLRTLAGDEALSPTNFGLSTHNAIAAQYGIARKHVGQCLAVSAGSGTAEAAVIEALGLLADGVAAVLVVVYDGHLPEAYHPFNDEPDADYAWAMRLVATDGPGWSLALLPEPAASPVEASALPHGLDVLKFLIGGETTLDFAHGERHWRWQRHV